MGGLQEEKLQSEIQGRIERIEDSSGECLKKLQSQVLVPEDKARKLLKRKWAGLLVSCLHEPPPRRR